MQTHGWQDYLIRLLSVFQNKESRLKSKGIQIRRRWRSSQLVPIASPCVWKILPHVDTKNMRCMRKFLDCYCCNCLGERRWEGRQRSHFWKPIASFCHVTPHCEHALFLPRVRFRLRVSFCLRRMA
jgi:hypothetical protein